MSDAAKTLDQLNATIRRIEAELAKHYHVRARVELPTADGKRWLAFGKLANVWQLIVECGEQQSPLVNVPSTVRVSAMAKLSELREALEDEEKRSLEKARVATREAEVFLATLITDDEKENGK